MSSENIKKSKHYNTVLKEIDISNAKDVLRMIEWDCPYEYEGLQGILKCEGGSCIDCWAIALNAGDVSDIYDTD